MTSQITQLNKQANSEIVYIYFQVGWKKGDHCLALWRDGQVLDVLFPVITYHNFILMEDRDIRDLYFLNETESVRGCNFEPTVSLAFLNTPCYH